MQAPHEPAIVLDVLQHVEQAAVGNAAVANRRLVNRGVDHGREPPAVPGILRADAAWLEQRGLVSGFDQRLGDDPITAADVENEPVGMKPPHGGENAPVPVHEPERAVLETEAGGIVIHRIREGNGRIGIRPPQAGAGIEMEGVAERGNVDRDVSAG